MKAITIDGRIIAYDSSQQRDHAHRVLWDLWEIDCEDPGPEPTPEMLVQRAEFDANPWPSYTYDQWAGKALRILHGEWVRKSALYQTVQAIRGGDMSRVPNLPRWNESVRFVDVEMPPISSTVPPQLRGPSQSDFSKLEDDPTSE